MPVEIQQLNQDNGSTLKLSGPLDAAGAGMLLRAVTPLLRKKQVVLVDLSGVPSADSAGVAALAESLVLARRFGGRLRATGASPLVREALEKSPDPSPASVVTHTGFLESIGERTYDSADSVGSFLQLLADTAYWALVAPFKRLLPPPNAITVQALRIGLDALPIVGLIALLLGLIMAFQAAYQLRQFGANIFVANLVGISMVRELGPLMSAIVVAGRSGSAIAAELGTMVVGEEIDALKTMGINENRFLVVPRDLSPSPSPSRR